MYANHINANRVLVALAKSEGLKLKNTGEFDQALTALKALKGDAFNKAYAKLMVDVHVRALAQIDLHEKLKETPVGAFAQVVRTRVSDGVDKAKEL